MRVTRVILNSGGCDHRAGCRFAVIPGAGHLAMLADDAASTRIMSSNLAGPGVGQTVVLMHPGTLHAGSVNCGQVPRIMLAELIDAAS